MSLPQVPLLTPSPSTEWAEQLTKMGRGKHFIGDFLPPDELEKFMETFKALKVSRPAWVLSGNCLHPTASAREVVVASLTHMPL